METFRSCDRVHKKHDFDNVFRSGRRANSPHAAVIVRKTQGARTRLGLSVSKKAGGAVRRNGLKRWVRELFRRERFAFPERADIIVLITHPVRATFAEFRGALLSACARLR